MCIHVGKITRTYPVTRDAPIQRDRYNELHTIMLIYFQHIHKTHIN